MKPYKKKNVLRKFTNLYIALFFTAAVMVLSSVVILLAVPPENQSELFVRNVEYTMTVIPLTLIGCSIIIILWLFWRVNNISNALKHDLQYVGFWRSKPALEYFKEACVACASTPSGGYLVPVAKPQKHNLTPVMFKDLRLVDPDLNLKPYSRVKAFFGYGNFSLLKSFHNEKPIITLYGIIVGDSKTRIQEKAIHILVYETIQVANRIMKIRKLNPETNPIPLAAYLFRAASFKNNPKDKGVQDKAVMFWEAGKDLDFVHKTRSFDYESLVQLDGLPDEWVYETLGKEQNEVEESDKIIFITPAIGGRSTTQLTGKAGWGRTAAANQTCPVCQI